MDKQEVIRQVHSLNLPHGEYVVYGSGPLAALGIRSVNDIDMLVSSRLLKELAEKGWVKEYKGELDEPLTHGVFEAYDNWNFSKYSPPLEELLDRSFTVDGVTFASVEDVLKWKASGARNKDKADVTLIKEYLRTL